MLSPKLVSNILVRTGHIGQDDAEKLKREARTMPQRKTSARAFEQTSPAYELIERLQFSNRANGGKALTEVDVAQAIAADAGLDYVRIDPLRLNADLIEAKISRPFALRHRMLPLQMHDAQLQVACANPFDLEAIDSMRRLIGSDMSLVVASEPDILRAITEFYGLRQSVRRAEQDLTSGIDLGNLEALVQMKSEREIESSDQHIINAVEFMLQHAYDTRASDIHIEPKREYSLIRFRIDGVLHEIQQMPKLVHRAVVSRLKTMARLDIAEKRRPQDGRIKTKRKTHEVELRVSTLPVAFGEKVVLRIFDPDNFMRDLSGLGFEAEEQAMFEQFIERPHGIILVTGPTGSGKSTTLYSALGTLAREDLNITTIEEPIEMVNEAFNQVAVQVKAGVTFAAALRHILRQDPDVIMVGEIRDNETAQYAIQAAMDRPPRVLDNAHQRRVVRDHPAARPGDRVLHDQLDPDRHHGPATRQTHLQRLRSRPGSEQRRDPRAQPERPRRQAGPGQAGRGMLRVPFDRLLRAHRNLRDDAGRRVHQTPRDLWSRLARDQARVDQERHAHAPAECLAQAGGGRHHGRRSRSGHRHLTHADLATKRSWALASTTPRARGVS